MDALSPRSDILLAALADAVPRWQRQAAALDATGGFPHDELRELTQLGALRAPLPAALGGSGWGTEAEGAAGLLALLKRLGQGNLAVGRVFEGHVNALQLVNRYGTPAQAGRAAEDAAAGHLFAVWNTEPPAGVRLAGDGTLQGKKIFCSAAGAATRALITATPAEEAPRMLLIALEPGARVGPDSWQLQGMRACGTGSMVFDGCMVAADDRIGAPGDYLRQPCFSAGAWRTSAVTVGGLEALVRAARAQLVARGRDGDPHQRARIGAALIAQETARAWLRKAAAIAEGGAAPAADITATVNLARIAIESACLEAMQLVQRAIGLAGLVQGNPLERMLRDLTTYLRQPAPDETLTEAAAHFMEREIPDDSQAA